MSYTGAGSLKVKPMEMMTSSSTDTPNAQNQASHISLSADQQRMSWVQEMDKDGDGKIQMSEIAHLANLKQQADQTNRALKRGFIAMAVLVIILVGLTIGLTFVAITKATQDAPKSQTDGFVTSSDGLSLGKVGVASHKVPLYVLPVLPKDDLEQMEMISITLTALEINTESTFYQSGEGTQDTEFGFKVASYARINTTFAVFHDYAGNQLSVRNGGVHFRFAPNYFFKGEYRVCSSNITCANTELEGVDVPALRTYATDELVKVSATIDIDMFRHRRQLAVVEVTTLLREMIYDDCLGYQERSQFINCFQVDASNDLCYQTDACISTIDNIMNGCAKNNEFDSAQVCEGETQGLLEALFDCGK